MNGEDNGESEDTEPATVQFTRSSMERTEPTGNPVPNEIAISISDDTDEEVSVDVGFDTSASTAGDDDLEGSFPKTVTFPAGADSGDEQSLTVSVTPDEEEEGDETAKLFLENVTENAELGDPNTLNFEIIDDDFVPVELQNITCPDNLGTGDSGTFTVTVNETATTPVSSQ